MAGSFSFSGAIGVVAVVACALSGCAGMGGAQAPRATVADAGALDATRSLSDAHLSGAQWPRADWWTRYHDRQLDALLDDALAHSPSLRIARARVDAAAALAGVAEAAGAPQLSANAAATYERFSYNSTVPKPLAGTSRWFNQATINLSYDFDFWGKNQAAIDAALDRWHGSAVDAQAARLALTQAVVQSYFRLAQSYAQLDLAERMLAEREQVSALTRQLTEAGIDSQVDLKQAQGSVPAIRQMIDARQEDIALLGHQLAALIGRGPDRALSLRRPTLTLDAPAGLPAALPAELIGHRPDVVAQRWRVEAAAADVGAARAQFYPNLSLVAYDGFQSLDFIPLLKAGSRINGVGPAFSLPLFDGGRLRGNLSARDADYDLAVEQYNQTVLDALRDVADQLSSIRWLAPRRAEQQLAVQLAGDAYDLALQRYRAGIGSYLQVLSVELQADAQRALLIDLDVRALQLDANLIHALGGAVAV
jgi:NodT family efflux transporter outer membrane factor (OMF) lipoprotein